MNPKLEPATIMPRNRQLRVYLQSSAAKLKSKGPQPPTIMRVPRQHQRRVKHG
jgi:hypothetical protein